MVSVVVIGTGYVGLVTGVCLADMGHQVHCVDIDTNKIAQLNRGELPIYEVGLEELMGRNRALGRLTFGTQLADGLAQADCVFLAVNTPASPSGEACLDYIMGAVETLRTCLSKGQAPLLRTVVIKSTVPVGTGARIQAFLDPLGVQVVANPEFLREGNAVQDALHPERIVIGSTHPEAQSVMTHLYQAYTRRGIPLVMTSVKTAELIKYAANAFLATKISFINECAVLCDAVGANVLDVAHAMGLDTRIGPHFLAPGPGFGGSCFPKDIQALHHTGAQHGVTMHMIEAVTRINQRQRKWVVDCVARLAPSPATIAILGLAFKAGTDDMRDAPSLFIVPALSKMGYTLRGYDPIAGSHAQAPLGQWMTLCHTIDGALEGADMAVILTEWDEFSSYPMAHFSCLTKRIILDTRHMIDPVHAQSHGIRVVGLGTCTE